MSIQNSDFEGAKEALERIENAEVKQKIAGQLWNAENRAVGKLASKAPRATVLDMVNGASEFEVHYLPTALNAWIKKDGEAAALWVEREGVNLPPETRQFVAIAYAREAASQGDITLADQWAELIVDEDRRARVIQGIDRKR